MKSSYSCMYLVPTDIYERLLDCLDSKDVQIVNDLNRNEIGNDQGAFPNLPPPPSLMSFGDDGFNFDDLHLNPLPGPSNQNLGPAAGPSNQNSDDSMQESSQQNLVTSSGIGMQQLTSNTARDSSSEDEMDQSVSTAGQLPEHYICSLCNERFVLLSALVNHRKEKHSQHTTPTTYTQMLPTTIASNAATALLNQPNFNSQVFQTPAPLRATGVPGPQRPPSPISTVANQLHSNPQVFQTGIAPNAQLLQEKYICSVCKERFASVRALVKHLKEKHHNTKKPGRPLNVASQPTSFPLGQDPSLAHLTVTADSTHLPTTTREEGPKIEPIERTDRVFRFSSNSAKTTGKRQKKVKPVNKGRHKLAKTINLAKRGFNGKYNTWSKKSKSVLDSDDESVVSESEPSPSSYDDISENWSVKSEAVLASEDEDMGEDVVFMPKPTLLSHGDIAVEVCNLCNAEFNKKKNLVRHIRNVHGADENYKQFETQGVKRKTFASAEKPKNVKRKPQYLFRCPLCSFLFVKENALNRHVKNVHGADENMRQIEPQGVKRKLANFACSLCSNTYKSQKALDKHVASKQEHSIKQSSKFRCPTCSEILNSKKSLNNHLSTSHKKDVKNSKSNYDSWK